MDLTSAFEGLRRSQIVEAIHLLSRHLAEVRDRVALRKIIALDSHGDAAIETAVMRLASEIEATEGIPLQDLDQETRGRYLDELDSFFRQTIVVDLSNSEVDAALARLRQAS